MNPIVVALACVAALCACRSPSQGAVECRDEVHLSRACRPRPAAHATESPPPATPATALDVGVDPRFEILSVVFRLAEFREYSECLLPDYAAAVDAHFGPFRDHPAVRTARALRKRVGYDAIPNLALRVKDAQGFEPFRPLEDSALGLDGRWDPVVTAAFLKEVAAFARDADASSFLRAQAAYHAGLVAAAREVLVPGLDLPWFGRMFGSGEDPEVTLVVAPLDGPNNYGGWLDGPGGGRQLFAFLGPAKIGKGELPIFRPGQLGLAAHELLHSHVNPWAARHANDLDDVAAAVAAPVTERMRLQAYTTPRVVAIESIIRAFTIRYLRDHGREDQASAEERYAAQLGFYWMGELVSLLEVYAGDRVAYADFEAFTPRMLATFDAWGAQASARYAASEASRRARSAGLFVGGPAVVSTEPPSGSREVDPKTTELRFVFDRKMKPMVMVAPIDASFPRFEPGGKSWSADGKVLTLRVQLEPGQTYAFTINDPDFYPMQDAGGAPLAPTMIRFSTAGVRIDRAVRERGVRLAK